MPSPGTHSHSCARTTAAAAPTHASIATHTPLASRLVLIIANLHP
jgi:hypothetical protein